MPLMDSHNTKNLEEKIDRLSSKIDNNKMITPRDKLIETEEKLKDAIDKIMTQSNSSDWDKDPDIAFGRQKREKIENRLADKRKKFPTQEFSDRLLDHATILDLQIIVEKNKDNEELKKLFPAIQRNIELLGVLGEHRVLIMHHEKEVKEFHKQLVLGLCGYFDNLIENYQTGISRKAILWNFQIYLKEDESIGIEQAKQKVKEKAEKILATIIQKTNKQDQLIVEPNREYFFDVNDSKVGVHFSSYSTGGGKDGHSFQRMNVTIKSDNYEMLKQLNKDIGVKSWLAEWILPNTAMDALHVIQSIKKLRGKSDSGATVYEGNVRLSESMDFTIINTNDFKIWATLQGGPDIQTTIQLRFISGENEFTNVFDSFTPDNILKIIRGEMSPVQIQEIVKKACTEQ